MTSVAVLTRGAVVRLIDRTLDGSQESAADPDQTWSGVKLAARTMEANRMPLYLDTHKHIPGLTADGVASAHARDLEVQGKHGVSYMRYWFDEATGKVYCLAEAPNPDAMMDVHREAHGLLADEIVEVREGS